MWHNCNSAYDKNNSWQLQMGVCTCFQKSRPRRIKKALGRMLRGQPCSNPRWACFFLISAFGLPCLEEIFTVFGSERWSPILAKGKNIHTMVQTPHFGVKCKLLIFHDYSWYFVRSYSCAVRTVWPSHPLSLTWLKNRAKLNEVCTETHGCGGCTRGARWQKRAACPGDSGCWLKLAASGLPQKLHKSLNSKPPNFATN